MNIVVPDELYPRLTPPAIKLLGYYQQCEQPITEGAKVTADKTQLSQDAIVEGRKELERLGLIRLDRPKSNQVSILLINY